MSGSINIETRIEFDWNSLTISFKNEKLVIVFHPAFDVIASSESGTKVTCSGLTVLTRSINFLLGFPSIFSSVLIFSFSSKASEYRICLSSGLG